MEQSQKWTYLNSFDNRFGPSFFTQVPNSPGVYWLLNSRRGMLYVSSLKNLQQGLLAYKGLNPRTAPEKIIALLEQTHFVQWTGTQSLEDAKLIEIEILDQFTPPFNLKDLHHKNQCFLGANWGQKGFYFALSQNFSELACERIYGGFHKVEAQKIFSAILRLQWVCFHRQLLVFPPKPLLRPQQPKEFFMPYGQAGPGTLWPRQIEAFLTLKSQILLESYQEVLTTLPANHPVLSMKPQLEKDLMQLRVLFKRRIRSQKQSH